MLPNSNLAVAGYKMCHGFRWFQTEGKILSGNVNTWKTFKVKFAKGFPRDDVCNADETGISNWCSLSWLSFASHHEKKASSFKVSKDTIIATICCTACEVYHLPLMVKAQKPVTSRMWPTFKNGWCVCTFTGGGGMSGLETLGVGALAAAMREGQTERHRIGQDYNYAVHQFISILYWCPCIHWFN